MAHDGVEGAVSVATLYNTPTDRRSIAEWSFSNADSHQQILFAIARVYGKNLVSYVLEPLPEEDIPSFLVRHQAMHADMAAVTGIATNNYTALDFNDPSLLGYYFSLHAAEHVATHALLGI
jgi:hypothetical protein